MKASLSVFVRCQRALPSLRQRSPCHVSGPHCTHWCSPQSLKERRSGHARRRRRLPTRKLASFKEGRAADDSSPATAVAPAPAPAPTAIFAPDKVDSEIFHIALPTLATLAADPIASLISTAWVGRLGSQELASVGVALSVYNTVTKLFNVPLLSVTTSTVASSLGEDRGDLASRVGSAVSAAAMLALLIGALEGLLLGVFGVAGLGLWGAGPASPLHRDALGYLAVRALSAPATVLFMVLQGAFRGLGDTRAPFYATLLSNVANCVLEPLFIFALGWGVQGAAGAVAVAQVLSVGVLLVMLSKRCKLELAGPRALADMLPFLRPTGLLTLRSLCISGTFALATARAARTGAVHTAAHQVCFQVWLASSLLADSLAVAAQALLARGLAAGDKRTSNLVVGRTLQLGLWMGLALMAGLGVTSGLFPRLFTQDPAVLRVIGLIVPAVVASQPLNAAAFLMDGILFGVGGFQYAAQAMVLAVGPPCLIILLGSRAVTEAGGGPDAQLLVVWAGLASIMLMRFLVIYTPLRLKGGPFEKLGGDA